MDPLDSFIAVIRNLSRSGTGRVGAPPTRTSAQASEAAPKPVEHAGTDLQDRLRARLAALGAATPERRCEVFVETVLLSELSESAGTDPQFADLVGRVAQELSSDPRIGARLDELLTTSPHIRAP